MSADVLVVGAGVTGAAIAFHLSRLGVGDVLVVDRASVGSGMSCRSSALVRMHYTFGPEVELAVRSDQMFDTWQDLVGRPSCIRRTGFVRIVLPGEEARLRANVRMQRALGARAEVIDAAALSELAPGMRVDDIACAAWEEHGGYGDGAVVAGDLLAAAREWGVRYRPHAPALSLLRDGDRVTGIGTADGPEHAGTVVLAAGVWSPELGASMPGRIGPAVTIWRMSASEIAPRMLAFRPAKNVVGSKPPFSRFALSETGPLSRAKPSMLKFGATTPPDWLVPVCDDCEPPWAKFSGGGLLTKLRKTSGTPDGYGKPLGMYMVGS